MWYMFPQSVYKCFVWEWCENINVSDGDLMTKYTNTKLIIDTAVYWFRLLYSKDTIIHLR